MKIIYFHRISFEDSEKRFEDEARLLGMDLIKIKYKELRLEDERIMYEGLDIKDVDGWYFRAIGSELEWSKLLQRYAIKHHIPVVDDYLLLEGPLRRFKSVMGVQLLEGGVNYPRTSMVESLVDLRKELGGWNFPIVVKLSQGGRHGMGTFWLKQESDLVEFEEKLEERKRIAKSEGKEALKLRGFLVQEYIPNDGDYRVMTVGYRCIGGFKRAPKEEKMVMNKSVGKSSSLEEVPEEVVKQAEAAAKELQVEVAGTDLIRDKRDGRIYVVEVNEAPQFKVFEKRTGVNVAKKILEYLMEKFG